MTVANVAIIKVIKKVIETSPVFSPESVNKVAPQYTTKRTTNHTKAENIVLTLDGVNISSIGSVGRFSVRKSFTNRDTKYPMITNTKVPT